MQLIYFITDVDLNGGAGPVLSIAGAPAPGATLQTAPNTLLPSQLWQVTSQGLIISAYNSTLALTAGDNNALTVETLQPGSASQIWNLAGGQDNLVAIVNSLYSALLTVSSPNDPYNSAVGLAAGNNSLAQMWSGVSQGCNSLLTTVTNATGNALTLTAQAIEGTTNLSGSIPLPPNTSVTVLSSYQNGLATGFGIWDAGYSSSNTVASFNTHQHDCVLKAGDVWVDTINYVDGYFVTNVQTQEGSHSDSLPGNASVTIAN